MSTLITYFSAEGNTRRIAESASKLLSADIFEIKPEKPYSRADINWMNPVSRCNREKIGKKDVPVIGKVENFDSYDTVLIGFPIWYGCAPNVVNTFCKAYVWNGKTIHAFATSGGSGIGKRTEMLSPYVRGAISVDAKLVPSAADLK